MHIERIILDHSRTEIHVRCISAAVDAEIHASSPGLMQCSMYMSAVQAKSLPHFGSAALYIAHPQANIAMGQHMSPANYQGQIICLHRLIIMQEKKSHRSPLHVPKRCRKDLRSGVTFPLDCAERRGEFVTPASS